MSLDDCQLLQNYENLRIILGWHESNSVPLSLPLKIEKITDEDGLLTSFQKATSFIDINVINSARIKFIIGHYNYEPYYPYVVMEKIYS